MVNEKTIESLGYRVEALVDSLCGPAEGDIEESRRRKLAQWVHPLQDQDQELMYRDFQEIGRCPPSSRPDDDSKGYCTILEQCRKHTEAQ